MYDIGTLIYSILNKLKSPWRKFYSVLACLVMLGALTFVIMKISQGSMSGISLYISYGGLIALGVLLIIGTIGFILAKPEEKKLSEND